MLGAAAVVNTVNRGAASLLGRSPLAEIVLTCGVTTAEDDKAVDATDCAAAIA